MSTDEIVRVSVGTRNILSIGYRLDVPSELPGVAAGTMEVEFNGGALYRYYEVPQSVFGELTQTTQSLGSRFHALIKLGGYRYERLTPQNTR